MPDQHPAGPHVVTPAGRPATPPAPGVAPEHVPARSLLFPRPPATTGAGTPVLAVDPEAAAVRPVAHPAPPRPPAGAGARRTAAPGPPVRAADPSQGPRGTHPPAKPDVPRFPAPHLPDWRYDA
ncbi:hypothetical protein BJP25_26880 [Actinokineospora bangkokensis]|uniref:Uncharacterized protein n=1 Tax=Actinokineospora bangkokensis TaxID=1193682 RepID=A0A1Q9LGZ4_9PSEU|nr:hypothetical protein BJP25_26880 [Actinokineospora bangkokensis]